MTNDLFTPYHDSSIKDQRLANSYAASELAINIPSTTGQADYLAAAVMPSKLRWLLLTILVMLFGLVARLGYLQIWRGQNYLALAEDNRIQLEYVPASRGLIYDTAGQALVHNVPNFTVTLIPNDLPDDASKRRSIIQQTATALQQDPVQLQQQVVDQIQKKLGAQPLTLQEYVPYEQALGLAAKIDSLPGVAVTVVSARSYDQAPVWSHILGYLGKLTPEDVQSDHYQDYLLTDLIGKTGLESYYETDLRGHKGRARIEVDAFGVAQNTVAREEPIPGMNLTLTVDSTLQQNLYNGLAEYVDSHHLPGGAAVALDPRTGAIRALVSYPGYDSNAVMHGLSQADYQALVNDERKPLFNKAITGEYPAGSTFKLVMASAALQAGVISPNTTVNSVGGIRIGQALFPDWNLAGHGVTNVTKALAESVNTFFYIAGGGIYHEDSRTIEGGLGISRIKQYAEQFGLDSTAGLDLPGEATGLVPDPDWKKNHTGDDWHIGDTYHVSIGQGDLLVTPLQVAQYTAVVANGGTLYQPHLLDHTTTASGQTNTVSPHIIRSQFINPDNLAVVRAGMRQAVTSGTARSLSDLPVTAAAKTGTAQDNSQNQAWFTVFAPYEDPQLVITVLVEHGGEGYRAAAPIAKQALAEYFH